LGKLKVEGGCTGFKLKNIVDVIEIFASNGAVEAFLSVFFT